MKVLLLLAALIMVFGPIQIQGSLAELNRMIWQLTGMRAGLSYAFYGCHCGLGGRGSPKDATDWCCAAHDCCYDRLEDLGCGTKSLDYNFKYSRGEITCSVNQDFCGQQLCHCDRLLAECLAQHQKSYSWKYLMGIKKSCEGESPSCSESRFFFT
ncbi:phospholipase A2, membrane associated precursor [Mesocricetus auratus]|uniref:Phospholipase A2 n=1 Tax=Mesocricetus auratus TaxID=10036 RepID=Q9QX68_MESAU|nr:phospholipase A2, membrane associated precursor [Mesocricetus auratus]CAB62564.1 src-associated phospholipase A2 [Mesocricetus auratus]